MKSDDSTRTRSTRWRDRRALAWLGGFSLDVRLAGRLLARYPVMTLAGAAAMAFGIAAGVSAYELRTQLVDPPIPLDQGARIVGLRYWDASRNLPVRPTTADVAAWRDQLTLVEDVGAFTSRSQNVITEDGAVEIETVAAMSPSAFRVARVPALLGRSLVDADAVPSAPPVVVIGHDLWQRRFASDRGVLGKAVRVGHESRIVVGVMPPGFVFPSAHDLWAPLPDRVTAAAEDERERLSLSRMGSTTPNSWASPWTTVVQKRSCP